MLRDAGPVHRVEIDQKCRRAKDLKDPKFHKIAKPGISLDDDFVFDSDVAVMKPIMICDPANRNGAAVRHATTYQRRYRIRGEKVDPKRSAEITDDFGTRR